MFGKLFGKKSAKASYDIVEIQKDTYTVHLTADQSNILASKGLQDVREITLTRGESTWKVEYSYMLPGGSWKDVSSGGIAFSSDSIESVLESFFSC